MRKYETKRGSPEWKTKIGLANRGERTNFKCDYCDRDAWDKPSHFKRKERHFCSQVCYSLYRERIMPSHEQPTWRGGITRLTQLGRGTKLYKQWQRAVKERDGKCVWCGSEDQLEADHIRRWSTHPHLRYDITNGRTLCRPCHNKTLTRSFVDNPDLLPSA